MLAVLPFLILILVAKRSADLSGDLASRREALLVGALFCAIWSAVGSELLSLLGEIRFWPVLLWWLLPLLCYCLTKTHSKQSGNTPPGSSAKSPDSAAIAPLRLTWRGKSALAVAAIIMTYALGGALLSPPNNFDSLAYHMPRIIFWMQQHSLANYPTSDPLQLCMPPGLEMIGLQLMVLAHGNDWAINLIGWLTALFLGFAASLICRELGGNKDSEALCGLMVVSMPMVFCSASTFTPEILEALWTTFAALLLLRISRTRRCKPFTFLCMAGAISLMPLTHGTGYLFGVPIAIFAAVAFWRTNRRRTIPWLVFIAIAVTVINSGYFVRNVQQFGDPLGPLHSKDPRLVLLNGEFNIQTIPVNILRTTASMLSGPSHLMNIGVDKIIFEIAGFLHLDIQNPQTMYVYPGVRIYFDGATYHAGNEDRVGWPFQMLLFLLIPPGLLLLRDKSSSAVCWKFLLVPAGCLIMAAAFLRWQAIATHLLPTIPALAAPVAAIVLNGKLFRWTTPLVLVGLFAWLVPTMLLFPRTLVGSQGVEFHSRDYLLCRDNDQPTRNVEQICNYLRAMKHPPRIIGLHIRGYMPYTYALLSSLLRSLPEKPVFVSFNAPYPVKGKPEADPDVIIAHVGPKTMTHKDTGTVYICARRFGFLPIAVYEKRSAAARSNSTQPAVKPARVKGTPATHPN